MRRISNDGLVEIANLNVNMSVRIGERPEIAEMAIATNPYWRSGRQGAALGFEPLVKSLRTATHVGVRIARHF